MSLSKLKLVILCLFCSILNYANAQQVDNYEHKLSLLQNRILEVQKDNGEWAGINEGDPRWDVYFLGYSLALYRSGVDFMTKDKLMKLAQETIERLKKFKGYKREGWALNANQEIDPGISFAILSVLHSYDNGKLVDNHFKSQARFKNKMGFGPKDMSYFDKSLLEMMNIKVGTKFPFTINPMMFALHKNESLISLADMGYYRWGFVAFTLWRYFSENKEKWHYANNITDMEVEQKGYYIFNPHLVPNEYRPFLFTLNSKRKKRAEIFWARQGLSWLLSRPRADGNPAPTLIVQMSLLAAHKAGVKDLSAELEQGWNYMNDLRFPMRDGAKVFQPSVSPIWDTARMLSAIDQIPKNLKVKGLRKNSSQISQALQFLLDQQNIRGGDYRMANPNFKPGGWGFAYGSQKYPDSDDTAMVLDALIPLAKENQKARKSLYRGVEWIAQMQNSDGGFPAWDFDATYSIELIIQNTNLLPNTSLESQADVTARVLRTLKRIDDSGLVEIPKGRLERGCRFLKRRSKRSSTGLDLWPGTWAVNYIYGTSEVLSTLLELDCFEIDHSVEYMDWLISVQNDDGGWGESVLTYSHKDYVPYQSTINQTLGALQLLLAYQKKRVEEGAGHLPNMTDSIEKGINYYLQFVADDGDIHDEDEGQFTACYACPTIYVRYDLIPLYMGTEVLGKYLRLKNELIYE